MYIHVHVYTCTCTYMYGNLVCTYALSGQASSPGDRTLLPATPTGLCQVEPVQRRLCGEPLMNDTLMEWHLNSYLLPPFSSSSSFHSLPPCPAAISHSIILSLPLFLSPSLPLPYLSTTHTLSLPPASLHAPGMASSSTRGFSGVTGLCLPRPQRPFLCRALSQHTHVSSSCSGCREIHIQ